MYIYIYIGVACKIKLGAKACKIKLGAKACKIKRGAMTNESYIILGFCQSILMNLSFHKKQRGGLPPANYGRYAYDLFSLLSSKQYMLYC